MQAEYTDLLKNRMDKKTFDKRLETHKRNFDTTLKTKVKKMLPESKLPELGNGSSWRILRYKYAVNKLYILLYTVYMVSYKNATY